MSGTIQKHDIISTEALKVFSEIVAEFKKLLTEAKNLKKELSKGGGFKETEEAAKKAKEGIFAVEKGMAKFNSMVSLQKQNQKETTNALIAAAKNIAAADKKATTAKKKNVSEWIAAAKRVATFEKKADRERRVAAKKKLADQKRDIAEWIAAAKRLAAFEKKAAAQKAAADRKEEAARKRKTGGLSRLIKSVALYAAAMFGLTRIIQFFTRDLLNLTKRLDSMAFSMRTIIKDQKELAATNIFLAKTAVNYGLDILTLTERYIKFRAASMQSNMSARETMNIFNSTAKAAAVLGLKTDEVNGVFLALEQMISKGKVTTEELRRQLGERLPGAMGIMADAMGVSISELDKMLKKGEVLSSVALPKFAVALEKAYGIESLDKVDNLASAQGRMTTAWVQFIDELKASKVYIAFLDAGTSFIKAISKLDTVDFLAATETEEKLKIINQRVNEISSSEDKLLFKRKAAVDLELKAIELGDTLIEQNKELERLSKTFGTQPTQLRLQIKAIRETETQMQSMIETARLLREETSKGAAFEPFNLDSYINDLDSAEEGTKSFANSSSKELREFLTKTTPLMTEQLNTYKSILLAEKERLVSLQASTKAEADRTQGLADDNENTKAWIKLNNDATAAALKLNNIIEGRIEVNNRLFELRKKEGKGIKDAFALEKSQMELRIALKKVELDRLGKLGDGGRVAEMKREIELFKFIKDQNDKLAKSANASVKQRIDTQKNAALAQSNVLSESLKRNTLIDKKFFDQSEEDFKRFSDQKVASIFADADTQRIAIQKGYTRQLLDAKNRGSKIKAINIKLAVDLLSIEHDAQQAIIDSSITSVEAKADAAEKQSQLEEQLQKTVRKGIIETERLKREELEKTFDFISENVNAGFNVQQQFSDNELQRAKNRYDREIQLAGDSEAAKLVAKRKFEKEERKIAKRQAKAAKAQAAFNIGLSTAQAIIGIWAQVPKFDFGISAGILTAVVGAIGAAQLAAVLAKPLPFFAEGVKNFTGGPAVVGDAKGNPTKAGGSELGILPGGQMFLTPSTPTVMNLPAGTDIIPNDMVAGTLANEAMNSTYNMIDMSSTNSQLRQINKNTSESTTFEGNYKIVRRKNFTGRYKV